MKKLKTNQTLKISANNALKVENYSLSGVLNAVKRSKDKNLNAYIKALGFTKASLNDALTPASVQKHWQVKIEGQLAYRFKGGMKVKSKFSYWDILNHLARVAKAKASV